MTRDPGSIQLYVLLGCTAAGKSALALPLAERLNAEILAVDSMQVYRGMDIGTAKPSVADRQRVRHHGLDLVEPAESFSVARFVECADAALHDAAARGRAILAVAGTPLYLMGLLYGLFDGPSASEPIRARLRQRAAVEGSAALHAELARLDPAAAARIHPNDVRRIERALEVHELTGEAISAQQRQWDRPPRRACRAVGLRRDRADLSARINARVREMIAAGLVDEVRGLQRGADGLSPQAAAAVGYAELIEHLTGRCALTDAIEQIKIHTRRLAKHQRTWFRRLPGVRWMDVPAGADAAALVEPALAALCGE